MRLVQNPLALAGRQRMGYRTLAARRLLTRDIEVQK
jgi:hypothetical protein